MMTSAILENGPIPLPHRALGAPGPSWRRKEYESVEEMRGAMSYQKVAEPAAFERANYLKVLASYRLLP
jgi:dihydroorotate dehydrogenase (fumarate)